MAAVIAGAALTFVACAPLKLKVSATTPMSEIVDACSAEQPDQRASNCEEVFGKIRQLTYMVFDSDIDEVVCGPDYHESVDAFRGQLIKWMALHPESRKLTLKEVLRPFAIEAYPCSKGKVR